MHVGRVLHWQQQRQQLMAVLQLLTVCGVAVERLGDVGCGVLAHH
jgi:hypothetical protein